MTFSEEIEFRLEVILLRVGEVEALVEEGGVGVEKLHRAVGVGRVGAEILPGLEIGAGLEIEALPASPDRLQQEIAVGLLRHITGRGLS